MAELGDKYGSGSLEVVSHVSDSSLGTSYYRFVINSGNELLFSQCIDTNAKQMSNYVIRKMARAFMKADLLANSILDFAIGDSNEPDFFERAVVAVETDALNLVITTAEMPSELSKSEIVVNISIYYPATIDDHNLPTAYQVLQRFDLTTSISEAMEFGMRMHDEALKVSNLKAFHGIPAPDDIGDW